MIYLASPYTDPSNLVMQNRYMEALEATVILLKRGLPIFSPIVHCHPLACLHEMPKDWYFWQTYAEDMINCARHMFVLQLEGWDRSIGVTKEIEHARALGLPIEFMTLEALRGENI